MSACEESVERIVEITGASQVEARHLLNACNANVEAAIALYFEQGGGAENAVRDETTAAAIAAEDGEDDIRAPIPPMREQLIGPEDDNFFAAAPTSSRLTRPSQRVKICPLRDFAREGALMEEQLQLQASDNTAVAAAASATDNSYSPTNSRRRRARAMLVSAQISRSAESSKLGDLFRPPTDIAYAGTFQTARKRSTELKNWLLVNVQSDNFDSQVLNRDVWSDKELRKMINRQFMLWQTDAESSEGRRFVAFYHCAKLPYVCVIDPRTGEEVWKSSEPKQSNVLPDLLKFLHEHNDFSKELEDNEPSTSKRLHANNCVTISDDDDDDTTASAKGENAKKRSKLMELSEDEQIALAIRNSMRENGVKSTTTTNGVNTANAADDDSDGDLESVDEFADDDTQSACERTSYEQELGQATTELTALKLRLLNAEGAEEVIQLRWPSDTHLKVLRHYVEQTHAHIPKRGYKIICAFPRKTLEATSDECSLKELGLHPSANLHLTLDD